MKFITTILFIIFNISYLSSQSWNRSDVKIYRSFDSLEKDYFYIENDTTYVINFWATWCGPCVKELPYFEDLSERYDDKPVKVILVSLDFEKQIDKRLIPFLNKKEIKSEVVLLLDPKESTWIDKVDSEWSGAIPITLLKSKNKSEFHEKVFHSKEELELLIETFIK
ncbi:MAG: TlpA family protein disulfide reductase [Saprospiraceae bacterium]|nr:TlpA family protein disulfide reductase [Bacteroidia bacterium]NNE14199.1 TlpA family protein disulfide reductase [Saprospiraceae bacterium]NNL91648.1 TlpA family protein disulfide reductase [Saprospiraceae bacterium]